MFALAICQNRICTRIKSYECYRRKMGSFSVAGGSQKSNDDLFTTNAQQMRIYFLSSHSTCRFAYHFQPNLCSPSAHSHHFDSLTFGCRRRQVFLHYFCFCALGAFDDQDIVGWRKKKQKWNAKCIKNEQRAHQSILKWLYSTHTRVPAHASILMMATATNGEVRLWRAERNNDEDVRETKRHYARNYANSVLLVWLLLLTL